MCDLKVIWLLNLYYWLWREAERTVTFSTDNLDITTCSTWQQGSKEKSHTLFSVSTSSHSTVWVSLPYLSSSPLSVLVSVCQVECWLTAWWNKIQQWVETSSGHAHIRGFTARYFGRQQTTNCFTKTRQVGQHINKINNVSRAKQEEQRRQGSAVFVLWSMPYIVHEFP